LHFQKPLPLAELLKLIESLTQGEVICPSGVQIPAEISALDSPHFSSSSSLTFFLQNAPASLFRKTSAAFAISEKRLNKTTYPYIVVLSVYEAIRLLMESLEGDFKYPAQGKSLGSIHPSAIVNGTVEKDAVVGAGCYVGPNSVIGSGSILEPNVTVMENCVIGKKCRVQPGVVIGCAGYGFYELKGRNLHIPHLAGVRIGDNVWIGANTVIAAGVLNPTRIGDNCKLDSHLQIAHNVLLGSEGMIASQSGIAGSTQIGSGLRMGGASSVAGHLTLGSNVTVAARTGVTKNIGDRDMVAGYPAQPLKDWKKQQIYLKEKARQSK
jgi:UDP-3-O-[3-hydroxymyristoyl] glucosamine N-acyltransferase LpxD